MTFRPDSPLNRLILLWPGVPVGACSFGFVLCLLEVSQSHNGSFAALAMAMGFGLALSIGLLFHTFFIAWLEISVTAEGLEVRPVGMAWFKARPRVVPWSRIEEAREVVTREGGHLTIATPVERLRLERALFREETYAELRAVVSDQVDRRRRSGGEAELLAA
ncbi:MAG TPA: hypothetical protein VET65_11885 [Candidatus Limnocylindrales bacterium]|nr:hypothetical protein [Candidatus Limnocylindrales bacterium]